MKSNEPSSANNSFSSLPDDPDPAMEAHDTKTTETHIRDSSQPKAKAKAKDPKVKNTNADNISVKDSPLPSIVKNYGT